ncbi:MAG: hypothetical protein WC004_00775 [Candidatus Absconditabacterales bacterium]
MKKSNEVEHGTIILPADQKVKKIAVETMTALGKPKPDVGKGTRIKKLSGQVGYAVKLDGLPTGSRETFEKIGKIK